MYNAHKLFKDFTLFEVLGYITLLQLWWIAVWGIAYIAIEHVAHKSKLLEFYIYCGLLVTVILVLVGNPQLIDHI